MSRSVYGSLSVASGAVLEDEHENDKMVSRGQNPPALLSAGTVMVDSPRQVIPVLYACSMHPTAVKRDLIFADSGQGA